MSAIRELIEAVERGEGLPPGEKGIGDVFDVWFPNAYSFIAPKFCGAYFGSVDAALELMGEVLPGWYLHMQYWTYDEPRTARVRLGDLHTAEADTPARALLLAILKAMQSQEDRR